MTTIALMQPTYLPWCGYLNIIDQADQFVLYDTAQFSHQTWQQRNQIRGQDGNLIWLTIPTKSPSFQPLNETLIAGDNWRPKHWRTIRNAYSHAPYWPNLEHLLEPIYSQTWQHLADLNTTLIRLLARHLGISTQITLASTMPPTRTGRIEQLEDIITHTQATHFLEPTGGTYLQPRTHIGQAEIIWHNYTPVEYTQGNQPWLPYLSIIDLIAWHGNDALNVIRQGYRSHK